MLRARLCPTCHLTVDDLLRLLAYIEEDGGMATLDDIRHALPDVARPVSGVLDLCEAGILEGDFTGLLDGSVQVWCASRRQLHPWDISSLTRAVVLRGVGDTSLRMPLPN